MEDYKFRGTKLPVDEKKARMKTTRNSMPEQHHHVRARNFNEVNLGYDEDTAVREARRCLLCPAPPCVKGCPVNIKIPEFIEKVAERKFIEALEVIKRDNALPAVTGRVCPQEVQCEEKCTQCKASGSSVGIGYLERFVADYERRSAQKCQIVKAGPTGKKVAVVGSGPGGLTVAADLGRQGNEVHLFEALQKGGGVLVYGIPEFRLPKEIVDYEIEQMACIGVNFRPNSIIGRIYTIDELFAKGYDAVYLGLGAGLPNFMNIPGESLNGVLSANEYLTRNNLMKGYLFPEYDTPVIRGKNVAVIGGGNVAMDCVRSALRLGAENAYLVYRRSREEMPARVEEVRHAEEEGVKFLFLHNPLKYIGDEHGWVRQMECQKMQLGEPDASGRRRPVPIKGSEFLVDVDLVVIAVGTSANPLLTKNTPGLELNKWGYILVDDRLRTTKKGVFAGGDIVRGAATVILAMGDGRTASASIAEYLQTGEWPEKIVPATFG
jgi:glutamate synthase (NADPH/NADH) small chain